MKVKRNKRRPKSIADKRKFNFLAYSMYLLMRHSSVQLEIIKASTMPIQEKRAAVAAELINGAKAATNLLKDQGRQKYLLRHSDRNKAKKIRNINDLFKPEINYEK